MGRSEQGVHRCTAAVPRDTESFPVHELTCQLGGWDWRRRVAWRCCRTRLEPPARRLRDMHTRFLSVSSDCTCSVLRMAGSKCRLFRHASFPSLPCCVTLHPSLSPPLATTARCRLGFVLDLLFRGPLGCLFKDLPRKRVVLA